MVLRKERRGPSGVRAAHPRLRQRLLPILVCAFMVLGAVGPAAAAGALTPASAGLPGPNAQLGGEGNAPHGGTLTPGAAAGSPEILDDVADVPARALTGASDLDHAGMAMVAAGDLNGDGLGDLAYTTRNPWSVNVVVGERAAMPLAPARTLKGSPGELFGVRLAGGGDLNGDGHDDLAVVVGVPRSDGTTVWHVEVIMGESTRLLGNQRQTITAPAFATTFAAGVDIVADVDGDGFDDLLVSANTPPGATAGGWCWLFAGSADGLDGTPAWAYQGPAGTAFGALATGAGDLNGDGLGDFVVTTGGVSSPSGYGSIFIFYGARQLLIAEPTVRDGEQRDDGFGASVAATDVNGDQKADLVVGAPRFDQSAEVPDVGKAYAIHGSASGVAPGWASVRAGASGQGYATTVAAVGDLNGDGYGDVVVGAPTASADGPFTNGQFFAYFGSASGLATSYDFTEAGAAGNDLYGAVAAGPGDLDGDGMDDLAVSAPGRDVAGHADAGAVYLYAGARLRLPEAGVILDFPDLTDGNVLARRPIAYHIVATVVYRAPLTDLDRVEFSLVAPSLGRAPTIHWPPGGQITMDAGDADLIELAPDTVAAPSGSIKHGHMLYVGLRFAWAFEEVEPVSVQLYAADRAGTNAELEDEGAFHVISSLEFSAPLAVEGDGGREVAPGGFVRAGEVLHWTGGSVAYAGTAVVPAASEFFVRVGGGALPPTRASVDGVTGQIDARRAAPQPGEPAPAAFVQAMAPNERVLAGVQVPMVVDGSPVAFGAANPPTGSTLSVADIEVSVPIDDAGSGVAAGSVEWSLSHTDPPQFTQWQVAPTTGSSPLVATAAVHLVEGQSNFLQLRAADLVGNGPAVSPVVRLGLDYGAVEFTMSSPQSGGWMRSGDIAFSFSVSNPRGVAIDLATMEYMVSTPAAGPWESAGLEGESESTNFALRLSLPDGVRNSVSLRATLVEGGTYQSPAFLVPVDSTPPSIKVLAPTAGAWLKDTGATSRVFIADSVSGVDTSTVHFRYLPPGANQWSLWLEPTLQSTPDGVVGSGALPVSDGTDNFVQWEFTDRAGNGPVRSGYQRILVDTQPVSFGPAMPADGAMLEAANRLSIAISDKDGSGVDLSTVEFVVYMPNGASTRWRSAGVEGIVSEVTVVVLFELPVGTSVIQWRAQDVAGTPVQTSDPVAVTVVPPRGLDLAPHLVLRSPIPGGTYLAGVDLKLDATPSFDPEGRTLAFSWWMDGEPLADTGPVVWVSVGPGRHVVTVVVYDGTASAVVKTVEFEVVPKAQLPGVLSSPLEQALVVAVAALALMAVGVRAWAEHARRALRW